MIALLDVLISYKERKGDFYPTKSIFSTDPSQQCPLVRPPLSFSTSLGIDLRKMEHLSEMFSLFSSHVQAMRVSQFLPSVLVTKFSNSLLQALSRENLTMRTNTFGEHTTRMLLFKYRDFDVTLTQTMSTRSNSVESMTFKIVYGESDETIILPTDKFITITGLKLRLFQLRNISREHNEHSTTKIVPVS